MSNQKERTRRWEARYFQPNEGFVGGGFVIFDDTVNPMAKDVGKLYRSFDGTSLFTMQKNELINLLIKLADSERAKEYSYLKRKINSLKANHILEGSQLIKDLESAATSSNFSAAFNRIFQTERDLEKVRGEKYDFATDAFTRRFGNTFHKVFSNFLQEETSGKRKTNWMTKGAETLTLDQLINEHIKNVFNFADESISTEASKAYKEALVEQIQNSDYFPSSARWVRNIKNPITVTGVKEMARKAKIKAGNNKSILDQTKNYLTRFFAGIALEFKIAEQGTTATSKGIHAGGSQQKTDTIILDRVEAEINTNDTGELADELQTYYNDIISKEAVSALDLIESMKGKDGFIISVSAKDYRSKYSMALGSGDFSGLKNRVSMISGQLGNKFNLQEFVFRLNNLTPGASLDSEQGREDFKKELGLLSAAWAFDDVEDMFSAAVSDKGSGNSIHLFNLNGIYFSLSEILYRIAGEIGGIQSKSLADVQVSWSTAGILKERREMATRSGRASIDELRSRWEKVRDTTMEKSSFRIAMHHSGIVEAGNAIRALLK